MPTRTSAAATIVLGDQDEIDAFEEVGRAFLREVLDLDWDQCLLTDMSSLSDFSICGLPSDRMPSGDNLDAVYDAWDAWVVPEIAMRYSVSLTTTSISLVYLFRQIEAVRKDQTVH